jgi:hypothetical protein
MPETCEMRTEGKVIYEITATVTRDLAEAYERYMLDKHMPDLLATGCFLSATMSTSEAGRYRFTYEAQDKEMLDRYLTTFARDLRQDHADHFPEGVASEREIWRVLGTFNS